MGEIFVLKINEWLVSIGLAKLRKPAQMLDRNPCGSYRFQGAALRNH